jgi:dehydrogenase/reductase SDR family member 12
LRLANFIDQALEASVAGSFTRIGAAIRKRTDSWEEFPPGCAQGKVVVVTGATSGLGLRTSTRLAELGATVVMVGRNPEKLKRVTSELRAQITNGTLEEAVADLGDLSQVRTLGAELIRRHRRLDVLIHNAGALDDVYAKTADGFECTLATHVIGPFLLTHLLLSRLVESSARVLWVASGGMYAEPLDVASLEMSAKNYDGVVAYAKAKRAQVTLASEFACRHSQLVSHAMHPGWVDTPGVARSLPRFRRLVGPLLRTPEQGGDTLLWLAIDRETPLQQNGRFWLDRRARSIHRTLASRRADTPEMRERLWSWAMSKSGLCV